MKNSYKKILNNLNQQNPIIFHDAQIGKEDISFTENRVAEKHT